MKKSAKLQEALSKAVIDGDEKAIEALLSEGADPNGISPLTGATPLRTACVLGWTSAVQVLLQHGADPNKKFTYHSPVDKRIEKDAVALLYAPSAEIVTVLLKAGAELNATDANGTTSLMRAASHGHLEVVKSLLAAGLSPFLRQQKKRGKKACTAREMAESKIELWEELKNESLKRRYQEIRAVLLDAEK